MQPNVLLVVLDAARRDAIEPYDGADATPTIRALAARGIAMRDAYATSSWTLPSHGSIFTGLLPRTLGLGQAPDGSPASARPALQHVRHRLLPRVLSEAGYETHGFSANLWVSEHAGFDDGFHDFSYVPSPRAKRIASPGDKRAGFAWAFEGLRAAGDDGAAELGERLRAAISGWSDAPAFWFVNLVECHSPYLPPRPYNDLSPLERCRAALDCQRYQSFTSVCRHIAGAQVIPDRSMARMRHLYGRSIAYMDGWLAGILAALARRGILEQTLVIVTSDHGENFGEGGLIGHGCSLDQRLIHVPLVIAGPGAPTENRLISLAELPALIARAAGLREHPWEHSELPAGVALAEWDRIAAPEDPRIRDFARTWSIDEEGVARLTAAFTAATDGARKLVIGDRGEQRYDLIGDPGERRPLPTDASGFDGLRAALSDGRSAPAAAPSPPLPDATASAADLEELEQQMKLLGYM